jgi:hypothetical protein
MTESLTLNKLTVLKRAVVGGLLSALATGIPMFIGHFLESQSINLLLSIFLKSFALPGVIISYPIHDPYGPPGLSLFGAHTCDSIYTTSIFSGWCFSMTRELARAAGT